MKALIIQQICSQINDTTSRIYKLECLQGTNQPFCIGTAIENAQEKLQILNKELKAAQ